MPIGVVTLTKVKHRRELLFASLPVLFAVHQFIEGFVWLGLDGILSPAVTHDMGAAFMLYAQGLLPFPATAQRAAVRAQRQEPPTHAAVPRAGRSYNALYFMGANGVSRRRYPSRETASCTSIKRRITRRSRCYM